MEGAAGPAEQIGREVMRFASVTSTMDVAWEAAERGAGHGTVVVAGVQTAGRGRFSRRWVSDAGESLLMSVLLRPGARAAPLLGVAAALAVGDAADALTGTACTFKWPNDVLLGGRKVCGILVEGRADTGGNITAVLGIGLNVDLDDAAHPELSESAASLSAAAGRTLDLMEVERAVLAAVRSRYRQCLDDPRGAVSDWASRLSTLGQRVTVRQRNGALAGVAERVDDSGRLVLRLASGVRRTVSEGEVTLAG